MACQSGGGGLDRHASGGGLRGSGGRASAASISAIVSPTPYSAMKPPKRGPSCWPSSTWYRQPNQARSSGNGWRLPTS